MIIIVLFCVVLIAVMSKVIRFAKKKVQHKKLVKSGIRDIDRMDGLQFEFYLKSLFQELGYKADVTSGSHDFGADLIMKKEGTKIVVQAKRYGYKNRVSLDAVQQVYAAKAYYKADDSYVVTNSLFTKSAKELGEVCGIKLVNRDGLIDMINAIEPSKNAKEIANEVEPKERICPSCDAKMVRRTSQKGKVFFGCSNYPICKHTENIAN